MVPNQRRGVTAVYIVEVSDASVPRTLRLDVNDDGHISPADALIVINALNGRSDAKLEYNRTDTNGDGTVSPHDALVIINRLNSLQAEDLDFALQNAFASARSTVDKMFEDSESEDRTNLDPVVSDTLGNLVLPELIIEEEMLHFAVKERKSVNNASGDSDVWDDNDDLVDAELYW